MAIRIRPFRSGDEDDLVLHANNPRIAATLRDSFPYPYTLQDAGQWIGRCQSDEPNGTVQRAIILNDRVIGGVGALRASDVYRYNAEVGYWLGEEYWGRGYTTQALHQLVDWLFAHTDLNRLYAGVFSFNEPSMRVLSKAGFQLEAIHQDAIYKNGQFWAEHYFVKFRPQKYVPR
ncbi:GNAT family N-acetyltransferase [Salmonirosea aquatica]|uniref:GNAT family N-acetyltransferase n=1 Tax=Salmonirosea aquatica TaxID=2654236 RepID=A0A7C9FBP0_9BACT|nr:GNAT family N-acetyltransferase [Cytophagaceae bacterium SJW1-29]